MSDHPAAARQRRLDRLRRTRELLARENSETNRRILRQEIEMLETSLNPPPVEP